MKWFSKKQEILVEERHLSPGLYIYQEPGQKAVYVDVIQDKDGELVVKFDDYMIKATELPSDATLVPEWR